MRVGIIGFKHESNSFVPRETPLSAFSSEILLTGEAIREQYGAGHHEISGFLQGLDAEGVEAVPLVFAYANPAGVVAREALETIWGMIVSELEAAGPLDGLLVAPHGAAVAVNEPDMDGWWLNELRRRVGPKVPIIAVMDPHANLSAFKIAPCNAVIVYRENPHIDQRQRGLEGAVLMARTLRGEVKPCVAGSHPPMVMNIERQSTREEPLLSLIAKLDEVRAQAGVLCVGAVFGYPYSDTPEMGSGFTVTTDGDPALAQALADELADWLMARREAYLGVLVSAEAALEQALSRPRPIGLLDMGDNTGGGAPSDSTFLAHQIDRDGRWRAFIPLLDPESVELAREAGVGARVRLAMGGKAEESPAPPFEALVTVVRLADGCFSESEPRHGGRVRFDMGPTAVVRTDTGLTFMLTTRPPASYSEGILRVGSLEASEFDLLVLRGVHAPVAAFAHLCPTLIRVNTPGVTSADMETLPYRNRRRPLYPFER